MTQCLIVNCRACGSHFQQFGLLRTRTQSRLQRRSGCGHVLTSWARYDDICCFYSILECLLYTRGAATTPYSVKHKYSVQKKSEYLDLKIVNKRGVAVCNVCASPNCSELSKGGIVISYFK